VDEGILVGGAVVPGLGLFEGRELQDDGPVDRFTLGGAEAPVGRLDCEVVTVGGLGGLLRVDRELVLVGDGQTAPTGTASAPKAGG
jgi:hypothetical protein